MKRLLSIAMMVPMALLAQQIESVSSWERESIIRVKGLEKAVSIAHITDSHITHLGDDDMQYEKYWRRMGAAYEGTRSYDGKECSRTQAFASVVEDAGSKGVDVIILSGDILNFPSNSAVDFVVGEMAKADAPYLYTAGNHDWHLEGMKGSLASLRSRWIESTLKPLYQGENPLYYAKVIGGVNFVMIDNSVHQVNQQQLDFFKEQQQKGLPIVLSMHVPIYITGESGGMGNPNWGYESDENYKLEGRERWPKGGCNQATKEFVKRVKEGSDIVVLAGHTHSSKFSSEGAMCQLTASYSRDATYRTIKLVPTK